MREAQRLAGARVLALDIDPRDRLVGRCDACGHYVPQDVLVHVQAGPSVFGYLLCGACFRCPVCQRNAHEELLVYGDMHGTVIGCHRCRPLMPHEKHDVLTAAWNRDPATSPCWMCTGEEEDERGGWRKIDVSAAGEKG